MAAMHLSTSVVGQLEYSPFPTSPDSSSNMGRPKVLPANRLRANTACTACRASKKRCSGSFPCSNCIHKGRARSCIPFKSIPDSPAPRPATRTSIEQNLSTTSAHTRDDWQIPSLPLAAEPQTPLVSPQNASTDPHLDLDQTGSRSPEATHRTHPRMLRNLQGERGRVIQ